MFKFELDEKWIKKVHEQCEKVVKTRIKEMFEYTARGIVSDAIRSALATELKKPEYETKLKELVKEMLIDAQAKEIVQTFLKRY